MKNVSDYLVDLSSEDEKIRLNAVIELGDSDDESALSVLAKFKADKNSAVRFYVKKSILKLKTKFQNSKADELINEISDEVREKILKIKIIEKIKDRSKIDKLFSDFEQENDELIRSTIVSVLGKLCDESHLEKIFKYTENADSRIVANAVEAIESINSEKSIDHLKNLLFHDDSRVKANVCKALWNFAPAKKEVASMVMARLRELITSDKPWIRSSAIYVLSTIKTDEAVELIKTCKNDPEKIIKDQAGETLKKIGFVEAPPPVPEEKKAHIEELPPDDIWPKVVFYSKKFYKYASEKYAVLSEKYSDSDYRDKMKIRLKQAGIGMVALFFFVVTFNAVWELLYPPPKKAAPVQSVIRQSLSNNILEAAGYLKELKYSESISRLLKELEKNPGDPVAKKLLGVAYNQQSESLMKNGKNDEAAALLDKVIELAPELADAYLKYSKILMIQNNKAKAVEMMKKGLEREPRNSSLNYEYAKFLISNSEFAAARDCLQTVIEIEPANALAYYYLADCLLSLNEKTLARESYNKALSLDPKQYDIRLRTADRFLENDLVSDAISELAEITFKNPKKIKLREKLGNIYFQISNFRGAADEFKAVLKENPNDYEVNFKIALCYQALDNIDEMFRYVYNSVKINANFYPAYFTLGSVYEYKKMEAAAKTCYDRVIKLKPDRPNGYVALANLYINGNQAANAITVLNNALKTMPDNPEILYNLGLAYLSAKDNKNAKDTLSRLMTIVEKDKETPEYRRVAEIVSKL
ncbi:MAG TPA: tetratricopeptide repeat protein [Candidatus Wallbacteria bacterium]|nr:MAG: cellulose synthase subunit BcsC [bacterium ADurb.Bin243]HPG56780.1 tetratricopeptide repeat protein [Candidatus Wallbacteria bacterium]